MSRSKRKALRRYREMMARREAFRDAMYAADRATLADAINRLVVGPNAPEGTVFVYDEAHSIDGVMLFDDVAHLLRCAACQPSFESSGRLARCMALVPKELR